MSDGRQTPAVPLQSERQGPLGACEHEYTGLDRPFLAPKSPRGRGVHQARPGVLYSPDNVPELMFTNPDDLSSPTERTPISPTTYLPQTNFPSQPNTADEQRLADGDSTKRDRSMAGAFRQSKGFEQEMAPRAGDELWADSPQLPSLDPRRRISNPAQQLPPIASLSTRSGEANRKPPSIYISNPANAWSDDSLYSTAQASSSVTSSASHYGPGSSYGSWDASPITETLGHNYSDTGVDMRSTHHEEFGSIPSRVPYVPSPSISAGVARMSDHLGLSTSSPSLMAPEISEKSSATVTGEQPLSASATDTKSPLSPKESLSSRSDKKSSASTSPTDVLSIDSLSTDDTNAKGKRRGKLPREVTEYLKDWLMKHAEHPYPTEDEKKDMCRHTGLHMTQLSNWFINARRRILAPSRSLRGYQGGASHGGGNSPSSTSAISRPPPSQGYTHSPTYSPSQYPGFTEPPYSNRAHYGPHVSHPEPGPFSEAPPLGSSLPRSQSFAGVPTYGQHLYYPSQAMPAPAPHPYSSVGGVLHGDPSPATSPPGSAGSVPMNYPGPGGMAPPPGLRLPHDMNMPMLYSPHPPGPRYYGREDPYSQSK